MCRLNTYQLSVSIISFQSLLIGSLGPNGQNVKRLLLIHQSKFPSVRESVNAIIVQFIAGSFLITVVIDNRRVSTQNSDNLLVLKM